MLDNEQLETWVDRVDTELVRYFSHKDFSCNPLDRAMEYTLLAGGKRMRPLLSLAVVHTLGGDVEAAIPFALASEFLHTYSLIHDDLPCMDDDEMRRGKPTNHVIFGEANAILAGDALQAEAFALLANSTFVGLSAGRRIAVFSEFAEAVGRRGMVAGQVMDLAAEGKDLDLDTLKLLHGRKTGALLRFCVRLGGHLMEADEAVMAALDTYARDIGLLFQVVDDLLDIEGDSAALGKTVGKDEAANKATFPKLLGVDEAHRVADSLLTDAHGALANIDADTTLLAELATYIRGRQS